MHIHTSVVHMPFKRGMTWYVPEFPCKTNRLPCESNDPSQPDSRSQAGLELSDIAALPSEWLSRATEEEATRPEGSMAASSPGRAG
jgi:hypothetical protein